MDCFRSSARHHHEGIIQWLPCSEKFPEADHQYYLSRNLFSQFVDLSRLENNHMHHVCAVLDLTKLDQHRSTSTNERNKEISRDTCHHRHVDHYNQSDIPYERQTRPRQPDAERQGGHARVCHAVKPVVHVPQPHVVRSGHRRPAGTLLSHKSSNDFSRAPPLEPQHNSIMATSRILHDGSSRSLAIKRSEESSSSCGVPLSKKCPSVHRTRSRSIAIKRVPLPKSEEPNSVSEYDWATWRMYNRIIEYRRKHPVNYSIEESREDDEANPEKDSSMMNLTHHGLPSFPESSSLVGCSDYGDIFQLDM